MYDIWSGMDDGSYNMEFFALGHSEKVAQSVHTYTVVERCRYGSMSLIPLQIVKFNPFFVT